MFQACPDFKGIKTLFARSLGSAQRFQACPDFKGIKTMPPGVRGVPQRFKLALISKGLKNARKQNRPFRACFAVRVVWSIKNQNRFVARWLQQVVRQHGYAG